MIAKQNSMRELTDILLTNEVAYQYCDGLVEFTEGVEHGIKTNQIIKFIKGKTVEVVSKENVNISSQYYDLIDWVISTDCLIEVDRSLLICIPQTMF